MNAKRINVLLTCGMAVLLAPAAAGYATHGRWASSTVLIRAHGTSFPSGSAYQNALVTVMDRFFRNPSNFCLNFQWNDSSCSLGNGQSEVWFSASDDYFPAVTFWWTNADNRIVEADVVFCSDEAYTTSMSRLALWTYGGASRPFQTTAIHEFGHVAGLSHEDDEYNIMGQDWTHIHSNGTTCRSYVGEDASDGLISLYGPASEPVDSVKIPAGFEFEDVAATVMRWTGRNGEYSQHGWCAVRNLNGVVVPSTPEVAGGQPKYEVNKGSSYLFEFTHENCGESAQNVRVWYYLSTDRTITRSDLCWAQREMYLGRNDVVTRSQRIDFPASMVPGTYYLGVLMDPTNSLAESDEENAAYHVIRIY